MDVTAHSSRQLPSHPLGVATVEVAFSAGPSAETGMLIAQSRQGSVHQREDCPHRDVTPRLVQNPEGAAIPPSCRPAIPLPPFDRHPPHGMNPAVATAKDAAAEGLAGATLHLMPTGRQPWGCYAPVVVALAGGVTPIGCGSALVRSTSSTARSPGFASAIPNADAGPRRGGWWPRRRGGSGGLCRPSGVERRAEKYAGRPCAIPSCRTSKWSW
jgi:hypothetical protein